MEEKIVLRARLLRVEIKVSPQMAEAFAAFERWRQQRADEDIARIAAKMEAEILGS